MEIRRLCTAGHRSVPIKLLGISQIDQTGLVCKELDHIRQVESKVLAELNALQSPGSIVIQGQMGILGSILTV